MRAKVHVLPFSVDTFDMARTIVFCAIEAVRWFHGIVLFSTPDHVLFSIYEAKVWLFLVAVGICVSCGEVYIHLDIKYYYGYLHSHNIFIIITSISTEDEKGFVLMNVKLQTQKVSTIIYKVYKTWISWQNV